MTTREYTEEEYDQFNAELMRKISVFNEHTTNPNYTVNYNTQLKESEMIKKQQDTIFLISSTVATIFVIFTIYIIKK
jgi:hypothetical protein